MIRQLNYLLLPLKNLRLFILLFPFLAIAGIYLLYQKEPFLLVHPSEGDLHTVITFDDRHQKGKSQATIVENQRNKLSYKYTISDAFLNPYAGIEFKSGESK